MSNHFFLLTAGILLFLSSCLPSAESDLTNEHLSAIRTSPIPTPGDTYAHAENGKEVELEDLTQTYTEVSLTNFNHLFDQKQLIANLKQQLRVLKYRKNKRYRVEELPIDDQRLVNTIQRMLEWADSGAEAVELQNYVEAHLIKGLDGKGNLRFTGYYTPVVKVSRKPSKRYKYPIYTRPTEWNGKLPTRRQIEADSVLAGKGLELAYAENAVDVYFMQVQGSGIVEFPDGSRQLFGNNGSNRRTYRSIGKYMMEKGYIEGGQASVKGIRKYLHQHPELLEEVLHVNDSYVFFTPAKGQPKGAGLVSLSKDYSIAVDPRYIPLGSCVLARVPIVRKNKVIEHEYRVLMAQDVGGAIKGPGRIDLYTGMGEEGRRYASRLHHYGQVWLLLSKDDQPLAMLENQ